VYATTLTGRLTKLVWKQARTRIN